MKSSGRCLQRSCPHNASKRLLLPRCSFGRMCPGSKKVPASLLLSLPGRWDTPLGVSGETPKDLSLVNPKGLPRGRVVWSTQDSVPPCPITHWQLMDGGDRCQKVGGPFGDRNRHLPSSAGTTCQGEFVSGGITAKLALSLLLFSYLPETNRFKLSLR